MGRLFWDKLKEALRAVLPVALLVILVVLTPLVDLTVREAVFFAVSTVFLILGIALFSLGADLAMTPIGDYTGSGLTKTRKIPLVCTVLIALGVLITVAEPDLTVLANQVSSAISSTALLLSVGIGVGFLLLISVLRILFKKNLSQLLMFFYFLIFAVAATALVNGRGAMIGLSFDSGGVTTGPLTVPFLMALGAGISATVGGRESGENSFGMIALCSVGPVLAMLLLSAFSKNNPVYELPTYSLPDDPVPSILKTLRSVSLEVLVALGLLIGAFLLINLFILKLPKRRLLTLGTGILITFFGLVLFLTAASVGYMPVGFMLGQSLSKGHPAILVGFATVLGAVVVLAEPAVLVLTRHVEDVTAGAISGRSVRIALSVGIGLSIGLSALRVVLHIPLLAFLIPGYLISLGLSFFVPPIYTAIAFDAGGVASGPLTSGFILPMMVGVASVLMSGGTGDDLLENAFGVVAMVAMTPMITIQLIGFKSVFAKAVRKRRLYKRIRSEDDGQIITFAVRTKGGAARHE